MCSSFDPIDRTKSLPSTRQREPGLHNMESSASSFPLNFFNGELETDSGIIHVHPSLDFKRFKALVSRMIGISSPHRISMSLVHARRKNVASWPEIRCGVPIDESSDFAKIAKERDCFILANLRSVGCEECAAAEEQGRLAEFHLCMYDPIIVGFRNKAGPIQRPSKPHVEP